MIPNIIIIRSTEEATNLVCEFNSALNFIRYNDLRTGKKEVFNDYLKNSLIDLRKSLLDDSISFRDFRSGIERLLSDFETQPSLMLKEEQLPAVQSGEYDEEIEEMKGYLSRIITYTSSLNSKYRSILSTYTRSSCGQWIIWKKAEGEYCRMAVEDCVPYKV